MSRDLDPEDLHARPWWKDYPTGTESRGAPVTECDDGNRCPICDARIDDVRLTDTEDGPQWVGDCFDCNTNVDLPQ